MLACNGTPEKGISDPDVQDTLTDTAPDTDDTDTDDLDVVEEDPIEEGRTATTICTAGGYVEGSFISGSFCFGAVDISQGVQATSASFQWQPGPIYPVSPQSLSVLCFLSLLCLLLAQDAFAVPLQMNHQGRLLDSDGNGLTDSHELIFRILNDPEDGYALFTETHPVDFGLLITLKEDGKH